jgi:hypothetical protein
MCLAGLAAFVCTSGCVSSIASLFNPEFLSDIGLGTRAASIPGAAPSILVLIENRTARVIDARLSWRIEGDRVETQVFTVLPDDSLGEALFCPVSELTLGDVGDLSALGAAVRLGNEGPNDPFVEVEPFGILLKDGANYDCGDAITFTVQPDSATLSGYRIYAFIQRAEESP